MNPESRIQNPECEGRKTGMDKRAFTLIELMVATAIVVIITLIVARVFQQASATWSTGTRKVEQIMNGRAVAGYIARELSRSVLTNASVSFDVSGLPLKFDVLDDASSSNRAIYKLSGTPASDLADGVSDVTIETFGKTSTGLPTFGLVTVKMSNQVFQTGAYFQNRDRNRL
jgi:prepilin-type N-terminal cleavage/methylation domain-containing protein